MEKELIFVPVDYDYFDWQGRNYVRMIGRDSNGKRVCVIDKFVPFFWAILKQGTTEKKIKKIQEKIKKIKIKSASRTTTVTKVEVHSKKFLSKDVQALKIFITNYKDAHAVAGKIGFSEIESRREYDLNLITKYIKEKNIIPLQHYKVSGELLNNSEKFGNIDSSLDVDICIYAEKIEKISSEKTFQPKILAFDIEADEFEIGKGEILMISLASKKFKKVLTFKHSLKKQDFVECYKSEEQMIEAFIKHVKQQDPDFLVGYFSDGFDLPYLRARAEKNKIKLNLGLDNKQPIFARGRIPSAKISGIIHIDLFRFISSVYSQYLQSETLGLNEVASELLGEKKIDFTFKHSSKLKEHEWKNYFEYNLQDSVLAYKLAEKFWPDMLEFSKIIHEPLFEITRNSMSQYVENYIIHNLDKFNEIAEKRPVHDEIIKRRQRRKYEGAFVFQPQPALYENLAVFDFTSMYASVIVTYNLSRASFREKKEKNIIEVKLGENEKVFFSKEKSFFPQMLAEIIEKRKKYKKEYKLNPNPIKKARSNAYKLLANASYGYQGFFGARYYQVEAAAATAALARKFIKDVIDKTNKENYKVIYADTDGFAFLLQKHTKKQTLDFLKKLNSQLPGIMELELEDFYKRGIWVTKRSGEFGAKKKYALIKEKNKFKIRGFETVRRDWCSLARQIQNKVLKLILENGNEKLALEEVKKIIKKIKNREIDKKQLIIKTQLKKPLSEYKAITPHVVAAQKIKEKGEPIDIGMLIKYFIAETKKKKTLVREKVKLPDEKGEYNIKYYLEHQILPAVENILEVFNINLKEIMDGKRQKKLGEF